MSRGKGRSRWECNACHKTAFGSESRAMETVVWAAGTGRGYVPKRAYPCPRGNGWHLSSKEEWY